MADWDAKYASTQAGLFGDAPNEYAREIVARSDFAAASALCLADGDGRNGRWLAGRGLAVTAVDLSEVATRKALRLDGEAGVRVERMAADLAHWAPEPGRAWDAVFLFYLQSDPATRARAVSIGAGALAPGGWFVLEGFAKAQAARPDLGPSDPALFYDLAEVEALLPGFQVVEALTGRVSLAEGERHRGEAEVVRFAARKPRADAPPGPAGV